MINDLWGLVKRNIIGSKTFIDTPFGKRLLTYADYTASGRGVEFLENYLKDLLKEYGNTHTDDDYTGEVTTERLHIAEKKIKKYLNAGSDYSIIEVGSGATGAINRMQEILGIYIPPATKKRLGEVYNEYFGEEGANRFYEFLMAKRPVVFIGPYEHHSNEISWRECFAEVIEVELTAAGELDLSDLEKKLKDSALSGRVMIGSFSAASNVSGVITPVYEVAKILHRYNAYAFFDFAASAPYKEINVHRDDSSYFDAVFFSPHKFLGGPGSAGILIFRRALYHGELPPTFSGGGTVDFVNFNTQQYSHAIEIREKPGTPPILQTMRAALALELKELMGVELIEKRETLLIEKALRRFDSISGVELLGVKDPKKRLGIFSFTVRGDNYTYLHPRYVVRLMNDLFGIQARAGCSCAGPYGHRLLNIDMEKSKEYYREIVDNGHKGIKPGWARFNFHFTMEDSEVDYILDAVEFISKYGKYFLPLYHFDIESGSWKMKNYKEKSVSLSVEDALKGYGGLENLTDVERRRLYGFYLEEAIKLGENLKKSFEENKLKCTRNDLIPYIYCA